MRTRSTTFVLAVCLAFSLSACTKANNSAASTTSATTPTTSTVPVANETVQISVTVGVDSASDRVEQVPLGSSVEITLRNPDAADNYHLHGYDIETGEVGADETATITFTADTAGTFEIESHETEQVLVVIEVV